MESHIFADAYNEIVDEPVAWEGGYIRVSDRPGIGVEILEERLDKFPHRSKEIFGACVTQCYASVAQWAESTLRALRASGNLG